MNLFEWKGSKFLLMVDYFSRFIEIVKVSGETCAEIIKHTKSILARHGIPEVIFTNNGPQFSAAEFGRFAKEYGFQHKTSSPHSLSLMARQRGQSRPSRDCFEKQKTHVGIQSQHYFRMGTALQSC